MVTKSSHYEKHASSTVKQKMQAILLQAILFDRLTVKRGSVSRGSYTQINIFEILLNQPKIRLYLPFFRLIWIQTNIRLDRFLACWGEPSS